MRLLSVDRASELALLALAAALAWQGAALLRPLLPGDAPVPLAALAPAQDPPAGELDRVRRLVDGNREGARAAVLALDSAYRSARAAELLARFLEGEREEGAAVRAWARAVRLDPALGDKRSPSFLGGRIGELAARELARLRSVKGERGLLPDEMRELEDVYYLRRRLAGGCE